MNVKVKYLLNLSNSNKFACFDIDHTIIKPKNNRKFPKNANDWLFYYDKITIDKLTKLSKKYNIIFFTNQSKLKEEFIEKYNSDSDFRVLTDKNVKDKTKIIMIK